MLRTIRNDRGAAAVEFALVLLPLLYILLGAVEYGRLYWAQNATTNMARIAVRTMVVDAAAQQSNPAGDAQSKVTAAATASGITPVTFSVVSQCGSGSQTARVKVSYAFTQLTGGLIPLPPSPLNAFADMRCES
jgi:Flp pilus assembly protein TadG